MKLAGAAPDISLSQASEFTCRELLCNEMLELLQVAAVIVECVQRQLALSLKMLEVAGNLCVGAAHGATLVDKRQQPRAGDIADTGKYVGCQVGGEPLRIRRAQHHQHEACL